MTDRIVSVDETFSLQADVLAKLIDDLGSTAAANVLGMAVHNPTTQVELTNPNGPTLTAIDPANLAVTFVAPASGKVTVHMEAEINQADGIPFWGVVSAGSVIPSTKVRVGAPVASGSTSERAVATVLAEGLTPGVTYTFQWATAVTTGQMKMRVGGSSSVIGTAMSGPAVMIVKDAPF